MDMSRKKKQKPDTQENVRTPGEAEKAEEKPTDIKEIQRQWQQDHIKAVEAERAAEKKRAEEEARREEEEKQRQELGQMLAEAAQKPADTEFDIKLSYGDMYRFDLYNTFHSSSGILSLVGAALVTLVTVFTAGQIGLIYTVIYAICAVIFIIYYPLLLIFQSRAEIDRSTILSNPLHYTILDSGVDILSRAVETDNEVVLLYREEYGLHHSERADFGPRGEGTEGAVCMEIIESRSPEETFAVGKRLAEAAAPGDILTLTGDLGVGKTVFVKGFAEGLGIAEPVTSPTFTILCEYKTGRIPLYHFDVYRIEDEDEMYAVGLDEYLSGDGVCLIEWAERIEDLLPREVKKITIEKDLSKDLDYRKITIEEHE